VTGVACWVQDWRGCGQDWNRRACARPVHQPPSRPELPLTQTRRPAALQMNFAMHSTNTLMGHSMSGGLRLNALSGAVDLIGSVMADPKLIAAHGALMLTAWCVLETQLLLQ
jgi:hypothetical protein